MRWMSASPLRSLCVAVAMAGSAISPAFAASDPCMKPSEKIAFDIARLKSELMVTAISCQVQSSYNDFVARFHADLISEEKALNSYFGRTSGRSAQKAHDDYITLLANSQSDDGLQQGTGFCDNHKQLFSEVLSLKDSKSLDDYAAAQPFAQAIAVVVCPDTGTKVKTAAAK